MGEDMKPITFVLIATVFCGLVSTAVAAGSTSSGGVKTLILSQDAGASSRRPGPSLTTKPLGVKPGPAEGISKSEMKVLAASALQRPGFGRAMAARFGLQGPFAEALDEHVRAIHHDPRFVAIVADKMYARRGDLRDRESVPRVSDLVVEDLLNALQVRGFSKMSDFDIQRYYYFLAALAKSSTQEECAHIYSTRVEAGMELQVISRMGIVPFREFLGLLRKAIFSSLDADMPVVEISELQKDKATAAFAKPLEIEWRKLPASRLDAVTSAVQNQKDAQPADVCTAYQIILDVAYAMPGDEGAWFRRDFLVNSQPQ